MPPEKRCGYSWPGIARAGMRTLSEEPHRLRLGLRSRHAARRISASAILETDGEHRIEARHRLLEDHRDLVRRTARISGSGGERGLPPR
jgi:hypothetical protein